MAHGSPRPDHARKVEEARRLRDERVDRIIRMMSNGSWDGSRSWRQLAAEWGVGENTVADYAREASGVIRRIVDGDKREILAEILAGVRHTRKLALERVRVVVSKDGNVNEYADPDCRSAIAADDLTLRSLGLIVQKTQDVSPYDGMSADELQAKAAELSERLKAAKGGSE